MEKITILLADDHKLVREAWSHLLNNDPRFEVVALAESEEQVLELAKKTKPRIILMDINMGNQSGFDITAKLCKLVPSSRVIGLSMHNIPIYAKKMLQMGAMGYVTKNSSKEELFQAIMEVNKGKTFICSEIKDILAAQEMNPKKDGPDINCLSKRELEITKYIKEGLLSREISTRLGLSIKTVEVHRYNILKKLTLPNSASLVNFVNQCGF